MTAAEARLAAAGLAAAALCMALLTAPLGADWPPHHVPRAAGLLPGVLAFLLAWSLMTGAMMLPSALPFVRILGRLGGERAALFGIAGFWLAWLAAGAFLAGALLALGDLPAALPPGGVEQVAAAVLAVSAAYQISPLAETCRRGCASPFAAIAPRWRGDRSAARQAASAGWAYGLACVGCCVPMIGVMMLVGMADVRWVFGLAALAALQKRPWWTRRHSMLVAALMAAAGAAIALGLWTPELASLRSLCGI